MHKAADGMMLCASCFCNLYLILSLIFVDVLFPFSAGVTLHPCGEIQALLFHIMKLVILCKLTLFAFSSLKFVSIQDVIKKCKMEKESHY